MANTSLVFQALGALVFLCATLSAFCFCLSFASKNKLASAKPVRRKDVKCIIISACKWFKGIEGEKKKDEAATSAKSGSPRPELNRVESKARAPLPMGWEAEVSRNNGKMYYVNKSLQLKQWHRPTI
ncbi:hypothetical protein SDRG_05624 [Saprolegnia diclina VS20]|uniref:WW domain-containing protein n=1 Tax=Saprolegnia diclina (strain VS20) TaxID=1156394 RepID=T0QPW8_SAPDV|nr:hypothetical protein SDRG_05624 [Saprolegnia diclina VS20]EQC36791.1 hypothetical protein SDRG_05624 [Saprolegnia diclina VS20]|eukprot:XP_008609572.1 hypothetical protein SDRG_05624 [Saprolegnia diclina VS20]